MRKVAVYAEYPLVQLGAVDGAWEGMGRGRHGHLTVRRQRTRIALERILRNTNMLAVVPVVVRRLAVRP